MPPSIFGIPIDPYLLSVLAALSGVILIIIALVPPLSIFILKNAGLTLDKRQSRMVAAIGGVLLLFGLIGIYSVNQYEEAQPKATGLDTDPDTPVTVSLNGTLLNITVLTENPRPTRFQNFLQEYFGKPRDLKFRFNLIDESGTGIIRETTPHNHLQLTIYPTDAGEKKIIVEAGPSINETMYSYEKRYEINLPKDEPPTIENVSSKLRDKKLIEIAVDAKDPENDPIYYYFNLISLSNASVYQIPPISGSYTENSTFWRLGENGSEYLLRVLIRDGDKKKSHPFDDRKPVYDKKWDIYI